MRTTIIAGILLFAAPAGLRSSQDLLDAARDQYASAAYEDALSTLGRMDASVAPEVARQAEEYRAFCLYALGRTGEAESVAESMIRREPLLRLGAADASPRLESMFTDVRRRLLPSLIRERYRTARAAVDQKSFGAAEAPLTEAHRMIAEAERIGVKDDGMADLNVLVDGFLQLIRSNAEQRIAAQPVVPAAAVPPPAPAAAGPAVRERADAPPAAAPAATAIVSRVYSAADEGVAPPVALEQRMPAMTTEMQQVAKAVKTRGMMDIVIDESGRVVDVTMRQSLNPTIDALIIRSARTWKYRPAAKDGTPVRYLKTLLLVP
jgi:periplasmic protein TonB